MTVQIPTTEDKQLVAEILGYKDWDDITDPRVPGRIDRERERVLELVVKNRKKSNTQSTIQSMRYSPNICLLVLSAGTNWSISKLSL